MNNLIRQLEVSLEAKYNVRKGCLLELPRIEQRLKETEAEIEEYETAIALLKEVK